jgi:L-alanine-DL-glutamate epimerase-like enolase superfamily enzyme
MYRLDRHLQTGLGMMAISAVDNALWDLRGKAAGQPVCRLLADRVRAALPAYRTTNDYPYDFQEMARFARAIVQEGYRHMKWYPRHGPGSGPEGMKTDTRMVRTLREAVGADVTLMFDCFMGWDLDHARAMAPILMEARPMWVEEPFPPRFLDSFRALRREFPGLPLATGEHLFTRWEAKPFLDEGLLAVIQCDPDWCGGITELLRICELAARCGVRVVPHGHTIAAAIQVVASQPERVCPLVEVLPRHLRRMQYFHRHPILPSGGQVATPSSPGLGIELDDSRYESCAEVFG